MNRKMPELSWASLALGILTKPLVIPFVPLFLVHTVRHYPLKRFLASSVATAGASFLVFLPFVSTGQLSRIFRDLITQVDVQPYLSVNAHNGWWFAGGRPWVPADTPILGPLSGRILGMLMFAAFYAWVLRRYWCSKNEDSLAQATAATALGFFFLSTHMHENHLFHFFPLACLLLPADSRLKKYFVLISITFLTNMALHDPFFYHWIQQLAPGPRWLLPPVPELLPVENLPLFKYFASLGYTHLLETWREECAVAWFVLTILNSQAGVLLFVSWLRDQDRRLTVAGRVVVGLFLVATLLHPMYRAYRFQSVARPAASPGSSQQ
jgi:hypothetical protein